MARPSGDGETINSGPAPQREQDVPDVAGNARQKGEDPSPDDRARGETSEADPAGAIDLDSTRERAG
ncbi:MAG TPA: hypothetical protein VK472_00420 [Allosphingosinicella sp.]|nr:hypothetical protein [Allosphingosinicella sp.]